MGIRSAALVAAATAAPAGNMVVLKQVCFHPKADGGACAVGATIHGAQDVASQLCGELTTCHTPAAFATCPDPSVPRFLESAVTGACAEASAGAYPAAGAARVGRAAALTLTSNIGHDLYNGILDVFALSERAPLDLLIADVNWFGGRASFDRAVADPKSSWTLTVTDALFNGTTPTPLHFVDNAAMPGGGGTTTVQQPLCVDELFVRAQSRLAENVGWDALRAVPALRRRVLERVLGGAPARKNERTVTVYTRGDANRRRFKSRDVGAATRRLGATAVVQRMARGDPRAQIELFAGSDVFVAPFGSNTANAVFMRPGSTFVEVTPLCASTCEEGCHPYSRTGPAGAASMADNYAGVSRANACLSLMADGPPLHYASGVNYHIVAMCSGTLRCDNGTMADPRTGRPAKIPRKAWKANFNDDLDLDRALPRLLAILDGSDNATRVAPFGFSCPRLVS